MPPKKYNQSKISKYAAAASSAYRGGRAALRLRAKLSGKSATANRGRRGGSKVLTRQKDIKTSSKRRQSGKSRRWEKFVKKIDKAINYSHELCCVVEQLNTVFNSGVAFSGANYQAVFNTDYFGGNKDLRLGNYSSVSISGIERMINDVRIQRDGTTSTLQTAQQNGNAQFEKFAVKSSSITFSLENQSGFLFAADTQVVYVDIYECISNMSMDATQVNYMSAQKAWEQCLADAATPLGGTGLAVPGYTKNRIDRSGTTPYHAPGFGKYWQITKYTRVQIDAGAKINYTSNGYRGMIDGKNYTGSNQVTKGKVKDFIIIVNPTFNPRSINLTTVLCELQWSKSYFLGTDLPGRFNPISATYTY